MDTCLREWDRIFFSSKMTKYGRSTSTRRPRSKSTKKLTKKVTKKATYNNPVMSGFKKLAPRPGPGGNEILCTLLYTERGSLTGAAVGAASTYQYAVNSLFDPNLTGTGSQPIPYDQLAVIYERYIVYEVEYRVVMANQSSGTDGVVGISFGDQTTTTTDHDRYIQNGQSEWNVLTRQGGSHDHLSFSGKIDLAAANGVTKQVYFSDDIYQSIVTGSPAEAYIMNIFSAALDPTATGPLIRYEVELRMKAKLFGNQLTVSS